MSARCRHFYLGGRVRPQGEKKLVRILNFWRAMVVLTLCQPNKLLRSPT